MYNSENNNNNKKKKDRIEPNRLETKKNLAWTVTFMRDEVKHTRHKKKEEQAVVIICEHITYRST